jgi:serine/threonine protein kinase
MKNKKIKNGGKILATGGFGCIFSPSLKCNGNKTRRKNMVTKLMIKKYARQEYDNILKLNNTLNKIPNYTNYFLINDFSICTPSKLNKSDLTNFNKCETLKKQNITKKNVNSSLSNLLALNMPYAGIPLDSFILKNKTYEKVVLMNEKLIELLLNGILPMNQMNIYHNDIKDSNILIDTKKNSDINVRLIDWSLTIHYIPFKNNTFPKNWRNRPLQFNIPFSVILFTDVFYDLYSNFLKENGIISNNQNIPELLNKNKKKINVLVKNYISDWIHVRGLGHYKYINKIMYMLFIHDVKQVENMQSDDDKKKYIEKHFTSQFIINYLVEILLNYTFFKRDGSLNMRDYLDNVFIKIVDIFGFIISYFPLYELLYENYSVLNEKQRLIFDKLKYIFLEYLYKPRIRVIDIDNLVDDLKNITTIIKLESPSNNNIAKNF